MSAPPLTPAEASLVANFGTLDEASKLRTLKRLIDSVPSPAQRELGIQLKKPKGSDPITSNNAIGLGMLLEALDVVSGVRWVDYVLDWVDKNYELQPNDFGGPQVDVSDRRTWRDKLYAGPDEANSTAQCYVPKKGAVKPAEKDGYVQFNIPALWTDILEASTNKGYSLGKKTAIHRLILLGSEIPPGTVENGEITEVSHTCGNPFCIRHLRWETKSLNQSRGVCFKAKPELQAIPCNGHGTNPKVYCVRTQNCAREDEQLNDPEVERLPGNRIADRRAMAECRLIRDFLAESSDQREQRRAAFKAVKGGGRGVSKFRAFFKSFPRFVSELVMPKYIRDKRDEFDARFDELRREALRDETALVAALQQKWRTPPSQLRAGPVQSPSQ